MVRGPGPASLQPQPARSYAQLRIPGIARCTADHALENAPAPASSMTVGAPAELEPVHRMWRRYPPTSMSLPGAGPAGRVWPLTAAHGSTMQTINSMARRGIGHLGRRVKRDLRLGWSCDRSVA